MRFRWRLNSHGGDVGRVRFLEDGEHHEGYSGGSGATFDHFNTLMRVAGGRVKSFASTTPTASSTLASYGSLGLRT